MVVPPTITQLHDQGSGWTPLGSLLYPNLPVGRTGFDGQLQPAADNYSIHHSSSSFLKTSTRMFLARLKTFFTMFCCNVTLSHATVHWYMRHCTARGTVVHRLALTVLPAGDTLTESGSPNPHSATLHAMRHTYSSHRYHTWGASRGM